MALYAKVNSQGEVLEVGPYLRLGSGSGEEARNSAAWEISQGHRIYRLMVVNDLMELAAETVLEVMTSDEGRNHDALHSPRSPQLEGALQQGLYGPWKAMPAEEHIRHAAAHLKQAAKVKPGATEPHLEHALCRLVMALAVRHHA